VFYPEGRPAIVPSFKPRPAICIECGQTFTRTHGTEVACPPATGRDCRAQRKSRQEARNLALSRQNRVNTRLETGVRQLAKRRL
jgi:hypothetical protein